MTHSRSVVVRVASFNALGILIPILIALYLDPKLPSHVLYPHRSYPVGLYYYLLLAVPVALAAAVSLAKGLRSPFSLLWSCVFLVVAGVFAAWRFPPETPHWGIIEGTFSYALLSFLTVYFARLRDDHRYLNHLALPYPGRLERLKATVSTFQLLTVYAGAGYLAFVVTLMYIMWNVGPLIIRCRGQQVIFGQVEIGQISFYSLLVLIGPLREALDATLEATRHLSSVREN